MADMNEWSFGTDEEMGELKKLNSEVVREISIRVSILKVALTSRPRSSRVQMISKHGKSWCELRNPSKEV